VFVFEFSNDILHIENRVAYEKNFERFAATSRILFHCLYVEINKEIYSLRKQKPMLIFMMTSWRL